MAETTRCIPINPLMIEGAVSVETGDSWIKPWRLPVSELPLFPPEDGLVARGEMAAGVRLHIRTDSSRVGVTFVPGNAPVPVDLTIAGQLVETIILEPGEEGVVFDSLPDGQKAVEVWFGQTSVVKLVNLLLDDGASMVIPNDTRPKWITYGSSITHCGAAHSPARTWPATAARARNLNLTCLGYGGQCHIDPMIARMIRDMPADFISLKLGINVCGGATLSTRTFRPAIIGMVKIIREAHPDVPIALISPIVSPPREDSDNAVGFSLKKMRVEVADAVKRLQACGDDKVTYIDGLTLFDEVWTTEYLPDDLHPNGDGYELMGRRFAETVIDPLFLG